MGVFNSFDADYMITITAIMKQYEYQPFGFHAGKTNIVNSVNLLSIVLEP